MDLPHQRGAATGIIMLMKLCSVGCQIKIDRARCWIQEYFRGVKVEC